MELTIGEWARHLWQLTGEPLNAIADSTLSSEDVIAIPRDLPTALDALRAKSGGRYRWVRAGRRYVVYPDEPAWDIIVRGVNILGRPRIDAAASYLDAVRAQVPALADIVGPGVIGDPRAPLYSQTVSLTQEASVVEHLVQLLGDAQNVAFLIERTGGGRRVMRFERVQRKAGTGNCEA